MNCNKEPNMLLVHELNAMATKATADKIRKEKRKRATLENQAVQAVKDFIETGFETFIRLAKKKENTLPLLRYLMYII